MQAGHGEFFITGGTLPPDAVSYVERQADADLYEALRHGWYCYVLTPRQMGKSSLMVRTAVRLRETGVRVAVVDLTAIGRNLTPTQWYRGMLTLLGQQLGLETELEACWTRLSHLGSVQRLFECLRLAALAPDSPPLVIFIDEIDVVRSLPFCADEFLAAIRECYNRRTRDADLARLTFCILGVARPSDLIQDNRSTPFNVSRRIDLQDFTGEEAAVFAVGIALGGAGVAPRGEREARALLRRILYWTGGHPYLTQRLCQATAGERGVVVSEVDRLCERLFLTPGARQQDDNLVFVRERLAPSQNRGDDEEVAALLHLYTRVWRGFRVRDSEADRSASLLRLSGVVRSDRGWLRVRNRIYQRVFDGEWILAHMPGAEIRRQRRAFQRGVLRTAAVALAAAVGIGSGLVARDHAQRRAQAEAAARHSRYVGDMQLAQRALERGDLAAATELLEAHRTPAPGEDLRGFEWHYLWRQTHGEVRTLARTILPVSTMRFRPDGAVILAQADGEISLVTLRGGDPSGRQIVQPAENWLMPPSFVTSLALSDDGMLSAQAHAPSVGSQLPARGWRLLVHDRFRRRAVHVPAGPGPITQVVLSGAAGLVAAAGRSPGGSGRAEIRIWRSADGQLVDRLRVAAPSVDSLVFAPNGRLLAASGDRTLYLWDVSTLRARRTARSLPGRSLPGRPLDLCFSPDGSHLAALLRAEPADPPGDQVWTASLGSQEIQPRVWRESESLTSLAIAPGAHTLAVGTQKGHLIFWDGVTGRERGRVYAHSGGVTAIQFSPDGKRVASAGEDNLAKLWATDTFGEMKMIGQPSPISGTVFAGNGRVFVTTASNGAVTAWDTPSGRRRWSCQADAGSPISVSADGGRMALARNGSLLVRDLVTGREDTLARNLGKIRQLTFIPNGSLLVQSASAPTLRMWSATGAEASCWIRAGGIRRLSVDRKGRVWATVSEANGLCIWDAERRVALARFEARTEGPVAVAPDGRWVAWGNGSTLHVYDLVQRQFHTLSGHIGSIEALAVSPDGRTLATAGEDDYILLWSLAAGRQVAMLTGSPRGTASVAFSQDGRDLAAGFGDGTTALWRSAQTSPGKRSD